MQDIDGVAHIEALAQPVRSRRPRVHPESLRLVLPSERVHRMGGDGNRGRHLGQEPAVRSLESQRAILLSLDPIPALVDHAMVSPTQ